MYLASSWLEIRLIDLFLDQLSTNSLLCRLRYDSSPCPSSSSVLRLPLLKVFQEYIGREREKEQYKKRTEQKMRKSQSNIKKKETQLGEKNEQWNARKKRERTWVLRVGYLTSEFEYFLEGFAHEMDQTSQKVDQDRTRWALSDSWINFFKCPPMAPKTWNHYEKTT